LTLQGIPIPESLTSLRNDVLLERQSLPDQRDWEEVVSRASHIFGITLQPLPTLANLQKLDGQVRELSGKHAGAVVNYLDVLRTKLPQICGGYSDAARFKTAASMNALCVAVQQTRKPLDLFTAIRNARIETSPAGMGVVFKQAEAIRKAVASVSLDVFKRLGEVQDERASVAQGLRRQIQDSLAADEHATSLEGMVEVWLKDSMSVLLDRPVPPPPPRPDPEIEPLPPITPPPVPKPGQKVFTGSKRASGIAGWKSIAAEIERELTEDAEVEVSWQIVKKTV